MAEKTLSTYHSHLLNGVQLIPSSGGVFEVTVGDQLVFSKKALDRFPEEGEAEAAIGAALGAS